MLNINTFDARAGGNVLYKALAHPVAAEATSRLYQRLADSGPVALYDPDGIAEALLALYPDLPGLCGLFAHDVTEVGTSRAGLTVRALTELAGSGAATVLIAAFDAGRMAARVRAMLPQGTTVLTLDEVRLPEAMLTNKARYLDRLNFATNFAFFRDAEGMSTRLVSANYWAGYGSAAVRLWLPPLRFRRRRTGDMGAASDARRRAVSRSIARRCASGSACRRSAVSFACTRSVSPATTS